MKSSPLMCIHVNKQKQVLHYIWLLWYRSSVTIAGLGPNHAPAKMISPLCCTHCSVTLINVADVHWV